VNTITYCIASLAIGLGLLSAITIAAARRKRAVERESVRLPVEAALNAVANTLGIARTEVAAFAYGEPVDTRLREQKQDPSLRSALLRGADARGGIGSVRLEDFADDPTIRNEILGALWLTALTQPS
jgi:hypothetical protein